MRHYTPRIVYSKASVEVPVDMFEKLTWGFTTIVLKCEVCGELKFKEIIGDASVSV